MLDDSKNAFATFAVCLVLRNNSMDYETEGVKDWLFILSMGKNNYVLALLQLSKPCSTKNGCPLDTRDTTAPLEN
jgi:hypothetical protein